MSHLKASRTYWKVCSGRCIPRFAPQPCSRKYGEAPPRRFTLYSKVIDFSLVWFIPSPFSPAHYFPGSSIIWCRSEFNNASLVCVSCRGVGSSGIVERKESNPFLKTTTFTFCSVGFLILILAEHWRIVVFWSSIYCNNRWSSLEWWNSTRWRSIRELVLHLMSLKLCTNPLKKISIYKLFPISYLRLWELSTFLTTISRLSSALRWTA